MKWIPDPADPFRGRYYLISDPARNAQAWRTAADMALVNPWFDDKTKQARYEHYIAEAQRLEALAGVAK